MPKFLSAFVPRGVSPAAFLKRLQPRRFHNPELHWILWSRCCESKPFNCLSQRYSFWQPFFSRIAFSSRAFSSYDNLLYVVPVVSFVRHSMLFKTFTQNSSQCNRKKERNPASDKDVKELNLFHTSIKFSIEQFSVQFYEMKESFPSFKETAIYLHV